MLRIRSASSSRASAGTGAVDHASAAASTGSHVQPLPEYVVLAETKERYAELVDAALADGSGFVPVLRSRWSSGLGLPLADTSFRRSRDAGGGACLALDEPGCVAAARLLCGMSNRDLTIVRPEAWEVAVERHVVADAGASSLALVLPCWDAAEASMAPATLAGTLRVLRRAESAGGTVPCGILTGLDAGALTHLVAKALLHDAVAQRYERSPAAIFVNDLEPTVEALPRWGDPPGGPIRIFGERDVRDGALDDPYSAVIFAGHGTTYCGCNGYLCTARDPEQDPAAPVASCHLGHDCRTEEYGRVDLRTYDTPMMTFASCCSGNMDGRFVRAGVPTIALVAAAAAPSVVVTPSGVADGNTLLNVLAPLAGASSAGEAVQRINAFRAASGCFGWFYMLGDPATSARTWQARSRWVADAAPVDEGGWRVEPTDAPLARIAVERDDEPSSAGSWFIAHDEGETVPASGRAFELPSGTELWISSARPDAGWTARLEHHALPELPPTLVVAAERIHERTSWWGDPLISHLGELERAAEETRFLDGLLSSMSNEISHDAPGDLERQVEAVVASWIRAQGRCLKTLWEGHARSLWPWRLWPVQLERIVDAADSTCSVCGTGQVTTHRYSLTRRSEREWVECPHCDIVQDWPVGSPIHASLAAPELLDEREDASVEIAFTNDGADAFVGAGLVMVSRQAPVRAMPAVFEIRIDGCSRQMLTSRLVLPPQGVTAHDYPLTALILLNGEPYWLGRPIRIVARSRVA